MEKWIIDVICGSIGGILGTFIGHPLDTIKVNFFIWKVSNSDIIQRLQLINQSLSENFKRRENFRFL